jgi:N-acetylmuramoyl-L-alanine amidase
MIAFAYYLLKVIICSGVLFLYYHIALRNKLFHQWNRFYLLISVFISLVAPVVQVSIMHQISGEPNKAIQMLQVFQSADGYLEEVTINGHQRLSSDQWLMIIYIVISVMLLLFALLSLRKILSIVRSHTVQWIERIKFVNTTAQGTPFSFFNFIFWNEEIDIQTETGKQIFQHELVHVKEKHTVDKLMMQLVLVMFWCNPFFWLIRRELQLIHEFIADKKSVGEHGTAALAAMILSSSYPTQFNALTNQFFQTSIKRRLAMLSKIQNVKFNYISRILALPILAITVLAFTLRTNTVSVPNLKLDKTITVVIDAGHGIMENGKPNGVSVNGISEDNLVLSIANKIKELNTNDKLKIILTRISDKIIDLHKRVDIARENNADLFISLHIDAKADAQNPGLTSEKSLNSGFGIYVSNKQPAYQSQSETLGSIVREELNSIYPTNPYLLKRQVGIWVLDQNVCPSILLECGFLNDEKDREFISKEKNQTAIAQKILLAIGRYAANDQSTQKTINDTVPKVQVKEVVLKNPSSSTGAETKKSDIKRNWKDNPPLFIVDGEEMSKEDIDKIDPATIESIDVLKGTSATDKYGEKGAYGLVEIK